MTKLNHSFRTLLAAMVASCALLAATSASFADKLHLKDGRVLDGTLVKKTGSFLYFKVAGKDKEELFDMSTVEKVVEETSNPAPATAPSTAPAKPATPAPAATPEKKPEAPATDPAKPADSSKKDDKAARSAGRLPRIAVLNFGPPSSWQGAAGNMVGTVVNQKAWQDVIPLLERDKVTDVIVRINSGGGLVLEMRPFNVLYQKEYKSRFRTVGWVESAISCAAMSPYPLEEFYFMPEGNLGACTAFGGPLIAVKGTGLEQIMINMEEASRWGNRSPFIMKAMQVRVPLSCNIDETTGEVTWFQDLSGSYIVNPPDKILTFTSSEAVKFKFAKAVAATPDDVAKAMGYTEYEWAGKEATKFIDDNMRSNDDQEKHFVKYYNLYRLNLGAAESAPARSTQRRSQVGIAKKHLEEMKKGVKVNPNIGLMNGVDNEWFMEQEEHIKDLLK